MVSPRAVDAAVEVSGSVVCQIREGVGDLPDSDASRADEILSRSGLDDPSPDEWYPLVELLDALDAVGDEALIHLGTTIPEGVEWPPSIETASEGFATVDEAYRLNHRGGDIGYYEFAEVAGRDRKVICANPYPCAFDKGIIEGTLRAFGGEFSYTPMIFLHETSERCRAEGGEKCTYRVSW
ncbi:hypothetical protein [Halorussus amylolyticus]|uniref:hypothetical protein n=1 Tax=Halorussus amylolyticus TaxID=1126242 RepID=UPI0010497A51|nr:hypothetical protein [Halorussus amylolyticus]